MDKYFNYFGLSGMLLGPIVLTLGRGWIELFIAVIYFLGLWGLYQSKEMIESLKGDLQEAESIIKKQENLHPEEINDYFYKTKFK